VCQLSLSKSSTNKTSTILPKSNRKGGSRCAGSIILIVRYNPLPNVFRGIPKGGSNVQVVSLDRGREGVRMVDTSESEDNSIRDRKCRTEPRGGGGLPNPVALSNPGSISSLGRNQADNQQPLSNNMDQIYLPPTAILNREQMNRGSPALRSISRSRHPTDEDHIIQGNRSVSQSLARSQNSSVLPPPGGSSSLNDLFDDDRPVKLTVNSDKTLSPQASLRGMQSEHSLRSGSLPCAPPPYRYPSPLPDPCGSAVNFGVNSDQIGSNSNGSANRYVPPR
jgi:hypothetical protein